MNQRVSYQDGYTLKLLQSFYCTSAMAAVDVAALCACSLLQVER